MTFDGLTSALVEESGDVSLFFSWEVVVHYRMLVLS